MKHYLLILLVFYITSFVNADSLSVISKEVYKCTEDTSVYVKIYYPQIQNISNKQVQNKINLMLEEQFLQFVDFYEEFISNVEVLDDYPADWVFYFEVTYRVTYLSNNFISVVMDYSDFTGGAHGNYSSQGYNIRLSDGQLLKLTDFIEGNQLENLSILCEKEIVKMFEVESILDVGLFEDEINLTDEQDFYVKQNCLVIQFDPYEIAPYSMGSIEVELNFELLKNILKPNLSL